MNDYNLILEKLAYLNETVKEDFYVLNKKLDEHIKKTYETFEKQSTFNQLFTEKFSKFSGGVIVAIACLGTIAGLMVHIYNNDKNISLENDRIHTETIKNLDNRVIKLEYTKGIK
jgi:hypothetical protein